MRTDCDINNLFSERAINDAFEHAKNAKLDKAEGNQLISHLYTGLITKSETSETTLRNFIDRTSHIHRF